MNDLIWIGNTLYPRWFVFAVIAVAIAVAIAALVGIGTFLKWILS